VQECEALCSRVGIMVGGRLRCLGSVQRLKSKFGTGLMTELRLKRLETAAREQRVAQSGLEENIPATGILAACEKMGDASRAGEIRADNDGAWVVMKELQRHGSVAASVFVDWWELEERGHALGAFLTQAFGAVVLVEQHESQFRYRLPAVSQPLAKVFELIEARKVELHVQEYSVSQTTLEQIFNQFASTQTEETGGVRGMADDFNRPGVAVMAGVASNAQGGLGRALHLHYESEL
jgi:ATP-binding cassette subfamily A (ABC1) protein 3